MIPELVPSLSKFLERQKYIEEIFLEPLGISFVRGAMTEIIGPASSGKSSLVLSVLAQLTQRGEICAVVDVCQGFDPLSAAANGVVLDNLLWIKGGNSLEKSFKAAGYLAQAKGFGAIWLNLSGAESKSLRTIPNSYWYRFRNLVKETPTLFLVTAPEVVIGPATIYSFLLSRPSTRWSGKGRFKLLREFHLRFVSRKMPVEPKDFCFELSYEDA
jgi:recombination protein RecA